MTLELKGNNSGVLCWQNLTLLFTILSRVSFSVNVCFHQDLNYNVVGWIDWNLCLDATGGPNWAKNFVDSPIIVFPEIDEFIKQPMFYAMGHFSKFIPRGSQRIKVVEHKSIFQSSVDNVAFLTPRNTVTVVLYNR